MDHDLEHYSSLVTIRSSNTLDGITKFLVTRFGGAAVR